MQAGTENRATAAAELKKCVAERGNSGPSPCLVGKGATGWAYRLGIERGEKRERENSNQAPIELLLIFPGKGSISIHKLHSYINQIHWRLVSFARMEVSKSLRPA